MNDEHASRSNESFCTSCHSVVHGAAEKRSRSDAELVSKLESALQELDETIYWLELLIESGIVPSQRLEPLITEANELIAIIVTSVKTVKKRRRR